MNNVYFQAEQVGNVYRGLVIDSKTFDTVSITAHTYSDRTVATEAARRMHLESEFMAMAEKLQLALAVSDGAA